MISKEGPPAAWCHLTLRTLSLLLWSSAAPGTAPEVLDVVCAVHSKAVGAWLPLPRFQKML